MNWLDTAWIALASASATLGLLHLLIWRSRTSEFAHLLFFALTSSIAAVAAFGLAMMQSVTAEHYAAAHVPLSIEGVDGKGAMLRFVLPWVGDSLGSTDLRLCLRSMMTPRC
jgi:hypothetical protein